MNTPFPGLIPIPWTNQDLILYHGTIDKYVPSIINGINFSKGNPYSDFGKGFYTTTLERQARSWAWQLSQQTSGSNPAVIQFDVDRESLADLECLSFVRSGFDAEIFWSLVFFCRQGGAGHQRMAGVSSFYDVVIGPVAAFWYQRLTVYDADQFSFHTKKAVDLLNYSNPKDIS